MPDALAHPTRAQTLSVDEIEAAFVAANPGLAGDGIAVQCAAGRLSEIRICLTKDLAFRRCLEIDDGGCRARTLTVPPVR